MNLSDDVSSNASESGAAADILQQCILDGMQKAIPQPTHSALSMMRCGASGPLSLPSYLPVNDEMGKYIVEDSPCNFSLMSGLSNLTVGSSLVGPAVQLKTANKSAVKSANNAEPKQQSTADNENRPMNAQAVWNDDSLSSLSIDSEDDTNLLSQAIAAGCSRPKSNLGFSTSSHNTKRSLTALSASQPLPTGGSLSASSLNTLATTSGAATRHKHGKSHQSKQKHTTQNLNGNESYSSVDSSDSNDNQSKSLFELCILTGMHNLSAGREFGSSSSSHSRKQALLSNSSRNRNAALGVGVGASAHEIQAMSNRLQKPQHLTHKLHQQTTQKQQQQPVQPAQQQQHHSSTLTPNRHLRERERERERKDEKLLMECINTGISKKINKEVRGTQQAPVIQQHQPQHQQQQTMFAQNVLMPKNVQATSAAVLEHTHQMEDITYKNVHSTVAATGVEKSNNICNSISSSTNNNNNNAQYNIVYNNNNNLHNNNNINQGDTIIDAAENLVELPQVAAVHTMYDALPNQEIAHMTMNAIGSNDSPEDEETQTGSDDSANISYILEPKALQLSNSYQPEPSNLISEKHKNPDLMLKSVERLTLEFVSSAERCNNARKNSIYNSGTNSHNTWNESTAENDVSFPSVSITAPNISSLQDSECSAHTELHDFAETTPTNEHEHQIYESGTFACQPQSLEAETLTLQNGVDFELGGEVKTAAAFQPSQMFGNSVMSKSTMIAIEARALAAGLKQVECHSDDNSLDLTYSIQSLDLDNVCPPSDMESGFYHELTQPNSLQPLQLATKSPKFPRKALPVGLMARRALGQLAGSAESVNSSCNMLDNIKPPSMMDDLLDSMISVASIQSEVADCDSLASTVSLTHFETAGLEQDFDDNTVTMQSCLTDNLTLEADKQTDSDSASTPLPSDNSSATSTPKHKGVKRTLTPKQKRKVAQDRFKTYTIAADMVLNEEHLNPKEQLPTEVNDEDETLQITILTPPSETATPRRAFNRRRSEAQDRYKTQTIIYNGNETSTDVATTDVNSLASTDDDPQSEEISSIRALTARFKYIQAEPVIETTAILKPAIEVEQEKVLVRGRKKIAYVSPYSKQAQKQTNAVRATIAKPVLAGKRSPAAKTTAVVKKSPPLERQGTFVQEEPTMDTAAVPVVETATSTPQRASKLPTKRTNNINTSNQSQLARKVNTSPAKPLGTVRRSSAGTPQRSNSNTNIRVATQSARLAMVTARGFTTTPPSRSNSNLNSNNSSTLKIQQAQSRIASIWKRVDEVKSKVPEKNTPPQATKQSQPKRTSAAKIPIQSKIAVNRSNLTTPNRSHV